MSPLEKMDIAGLVEDLRGYTKHDLDKLPNSILADIREAASTISSLSERVGDLEKELRAAQAKAENWEVRWNLVMGSLDAVRAEKAELAGALRTVIGCLDDPTGGTHVSDMRAAREAAQAAIQRAEGK